MSNFQDEWNALPANPIATPLREPYNWRKQAAKYAPWLSCGRYIATTAARFEPWMLETASTCRVQILTSTERDEVS